MSENPGDRLTTRRLRSPAGDLANTGARLVVIHGDSPGRCVELIDKPVTIGRVSGCDVQIDHSSVSRTHCTVWVQDGQFNIRDLGSTNKTVVNGHAVESSELKDGDTIAIGEIVLKFFRRESLEDRYHQVMVEMATVDTLTQLPNRRIWRSGLEGAVAKASEGAVLSLVFIDLDHFKRINDELGHLAGDDVLKAVAGVIRDSLAPGYLAGRLGGEEFAVVLPGVPLARAIDYAELLRQAIEDLQVDLPGGPRAITTSIGAVQWQPGFQAPADFMRAADAELFRAKSEGRNRVCAREIG
jgi:diguanylate cyclase (GGDEF)-like protein